ncbi:MAG: polyprenol monophosphomannose synthase [Thermodesulfobacteriota bacterium]|nr:polyprenol monophosphomannose synthase [Thermodesulfobacteriota bacterium]
MSILIIIPTYNERENISPLTEDLLNLDFHKHILIIDDNSSDGTRSVIEKLILKYPGKIKTIYRPQKQGLGSAYIQGFRYAQENGVKWVVTMDADLSHSPLYIEKMMEKATDEEFDLVIGSRYISGGGIENWPLYRKFLSRGANIFAHFFLRLPVHDYTSGYRFYKLETISRLSLDEIFSDGYSFLVEIVYRGYKSGWNIGEIPIIFTDRVAGKSKISKIEIFKAILTIFRLKYEYFMMR